MMVMQRSFKPLSAGSIPVLLSFSHQAGKVLVGARQISNLKGWVRTPLPALKMKWGHGITGEHTGLSTRS